MSKKKLYRFGYILFLLTSFLASKGSEQHSLPLLSNPGVPVASNFIDTLPAGKQETDKVKQQEAVQQDPQQPVKVVTDLPVVKQVPKSKKKIKPVKIDGQVSVPQPVIIKPKIVIKKIKL